MGGKCEGMKHIEKPFRCSNPNCNGGERRVICNRKLCGYKSLENEYDTVCRLCYITEKNRQTEYVDPDDLKSPVLNRVSGVKYDRLMNKFILDDDFFAII